MRSPPYPVPRKAIVLAAGFGTRLRPLTAVVPKPLLPLWGRPVLFGTLSILARWGVRDVLLNLHHQAGPIVDTIRRASASLPLRVCVSFEPAILGTGGALQRAAWFLDSEDPFWMVNADVAFNVDPRPLQQAMRTRRVLSVVWLEPDRGPRTVEAPGGRVRSFRSTDPGSPGTFTFTGLQLLRPDILRFLPAQGFSGIIEAYDAGLRHGWRIAGVPVPCSFWTDLGSPASYLDAHEEVRRRFRSHQPGRGWYSPAGDLARGRFARRGVVIRGVAAGDSAGVQAPCALRDCVLLPGAAIAAHSALQRVLVGPGARVSGRVRDAVALRAEDWPDPDLPLLLRRIRMDAASATVISLGARGSARSFLRLQALRRTAIVMRYDPERAENALYAPHARFLAACAIPVPRLLLDDPARNVCIVEDLGDDSLEEHVRRSGEAAVESLYRRVLRVVARLHTVATRAARRHPIPMTRPFSRRLFRWEHNYFSEQFLQGWLRLPPARWRDAAREMHAIGRQLEGLPQVLVHRDLQSTNILVRGGQPHLIDFQGMRFGPALYDLASLLCDPYVQLSLSLQRRLLRHYATRCPGAVPSESLFWAAAVQRLAQALGAYARLGSQPATASFARHIPPAVAMMQRALAQLPGCPHLRTLMHRIASSMA